MPRAPRQFENGGKQWTEEQDVILATHRHAGTRYHIIAEELGKTGLACRLHWMHLQRKEKARLAEAARIAKAAEEAARLDAERQAQHQAQAQAQVDTEAGMTTQDRPRLYRQEGVQTAGEARARLRLYRPEGDPATIEARDQHAAEENRARFRVGGFGALDRFIETHPIPVWTPANEPGQAPALTTAPTSASRRESSSLPSLDEFAERRASEINGANILYDIGRRHGGIRNDSVISNPAAQAAAQVDEAAKTEGTEGRARLPSLVQLGLLDLARKG